MSIKDPDLLFSNIELAILAILEQNYPKEHGKLAQRAGEMEKVFFDVHTLPTKKMDKYFTFRISEESDDDYRLFTSDIDVLLDIPKESFGVVVVHPSHVEEFCFTRLKQTPKHYAIHGSVDSVWQLDFYCTHAETLKRWKVQKVFALRERKVYPIYPYKTPAGIIREERISTTAMCSQHFALAASLVEDYNAKQFWHIDIEDSITIATYGAEHDIKELLDIRDEPLTKTGQRKRVLHWVSGHDRVRGGKRVHIDRHLRGLEEFTLGGFNIKITEPRKKEPSHG